MKYLLILIFTLFVSSGFGQRYIDIPNDLVLDSIAKENVKLKIVAVHKRGRMLLFKPIRWFKLTVKPKADFSRLTSVYYNNTLNEIFTDGVEFLLESTFSGMDFGDLMGFVKYDVRLKIYITPRMTLVNKVMMTGVNYNKYNYSVVYQYNF